MRELHSSILGAKAEPASCEDYIYQASEIPTTVALLFSNVKSILSEIERTFSSERYADTASESDAVSVIGDTLALPNRVLSGAADVLCFLRNGALTLVKWGEDLIDR